MVNEVLPGGDAAAALTTARKAKKPWYVLARIMEAEVQAVPEAERPAAISALGQAGGISPAVARRYLRLLERMREIAQEMGAAEDALLSTSFNAQELAERIYRSSKVEGAEVLHRVARGEVALPALRDMQARLQTSPNNNLRFAVGQMRDAAMFTIGSALKNDGAKIFGQGCVVRRRNPLEFVGNWGHEVIDEDGLIIAGTDSLFPEINPRSGDALERFIGRSLLMAQFFPRFYLVYAFSGEDEDMVSRTTEMLDWLRYDWIGVLVAPDEQTLLKVRPSNGPPTPNMSDRYDSYVRKYTSGLAIQRSRGHDTA